MLIEATDLLCSQIMVSYYMNSAECNQKTCEKDPVFATVSGWWRGKGLGRTQDRRDALDQGNK
jgi:hypothetical protein